MPRCLAARLRASRRPGKIKKTAKKIKKTQIFKHSPISGAVNRKIQMKNFARLVAFSALSIAATQGAHAQSSFVYVQPMYDGAPPPTQPRLDIMLDGVERSREGFLIPPHADERSVRASVAQGVDGGKATPARFKQTKREEDAVPTVVGIAQNTDGTAILKFPPSKSAVVVEPGVYKYSTTGPLAEVSFNAGAVDDPGRLASEKKSNIAGAVVLLGPLAAFGLAFGLWMSIECAPGGPKGWARAAARAMAPAERKDKKRPRMG